MENHLSSCTAQLSQWDASDGVGGMDIPSWTVSLWAEQKHAALPLRSLEESAGKCLEDV